MSAIKNGGPAFPVEWINKIDSGMTLRDYFAVRAPADIPEWFKYVPATPRPAVSIPHESLTPEQYKEWDGLGDWLDESDASPEVNAFDEKYESERAALEAWDAEQRVARYYAWRWAYADSMLRSRGAA
ncbi:hypothetical protein [Paraburkholderia sp. MM6662-R1]|uniref:hypothetical protein n=1 Tax=Paraburkholderia sp. MM6662-R1 TaxID=2991066 RepID=UPI003D1D7F49